MNKNFLATMLLLGLVGCSTSRRISTIPVLPTAAMEQKLDLAVYERKYPGKDGVYLNIDRTVEHVTMISYIADYASWDVFETTSRSYLILNKDAEWLTTFSLDVEPGCELESLSLGIVQPDGTRREFRREDLKVQTNSEKKTTYKLIYPNTVRGSRVTENFVIKRNSNNRSASNIDYPLQFNIPCEQMTFKFMHPDSWTAQLKKLGPDKALPVTTSKDDKANKVIVTYQAKDIPAVENEIYAPFFKEVSNYFRLMITKGWGSPAFANWSAFSRQFRNYAVDKAPIFSQRVENTLKDLRKGTKTPQEDLEAIVNFVQQNIDVGESMPNDNFADTLIKRKGNPYQITGLTQAMLSKAGVSSKYLLIHSARDGYFDKEFISFDELYLPTLSVTLGGKEMLLLPYVKQMPVNHIPEAFQGRPALEINKSDSANFVITPQGSASGNTQEEIYHVSLDEDGILKVKEEKLLEGTSAYQARQTLERLKKSEIDKALLKLLTYTDGKIDLKSYEFENLTDYKKPLRIKLVYTIDNLVSLTPEEVLFNTGGLFSPSSSVKTKVEAHTRQQPVRIYNDEHMTKRITLEFPKGWSITSPPDGFKQANRFGKVESTMNLAEGVLSVKQTLNLLKSEAPREAFPELLELLGGRSRLTLKTLVFKRPL